MSEAAASRAAAVTWLPRWSQLVPPVALVALAVSWGRDPGAVLLGITVVALVGAVLAAVHHAEVVAVWVGEPFGTLILAVAVTVIEVALIVTLMLSEPAGTDSTLARDTAFAAVMITCNGVVGLSLLMGPLRHRVLSFRTEGASGALAVLAALVSGAWSCPPSRSASPVRRKPARNWPSPVPLR